MLVACRAKLKTLDAEIEAIEAMIPHIADHDLERYHLGMIIDETELAPIEEHLLWCSRCIDRAEGAADYVDTMRRAVIEGGCDL